MNKNFADMTDAEIEAWVQDLSDKWSAGVLDVTNGATLNSEDFFQLLASFEYLGTTLTEKYGEFYKAVYYEAGRRYAEGTVAPTEK